MAATIDTRTHDEKREAVRALLRDPEWSQRSDRWIAEHAGVSHPFVRKQRQLETFPVGRKMGRDGKVRKARKARRKANRVALFSSVTDEWATPPDYFAEIDAEFRFTLDPCATAENAKCGIYFTRTDDGLAQDWGSHTVWMNPPYGRNQTGPWLRKAYESSLAGATVVCLVPARSDTKWWHNYAVQGEIRYVRGRLKFGGAKHSAPFPSVIVVFRPPG